MFRKIITLIFIISSIVCISFESNAATYNGPTPVKIDENVNFNFNIARQGNRSATVWYNDELAIAVENADSSTYDRDNMEVIVALFSAAKKSFENASGVSNLPLNGSYKNLPTIQVPLDNNGAGGLASHGAFGLSVGSQIFSDLEERIDNGNISFDQVWLYEMNRNYYKPSWNNLIDWAMDDSVKDYGFWTVGLNNAAAIWIIDEMGVELSYFGRDRDQFRDGMLGNYNTYIGDPSYTFDSAWRSRIMPWSNRETINDLMSGTLLYWYKNFGGIEFIRRLYSEIENNPLLDGSRRDYQSARDNWFRMVSRATQDNKASYFEDVLKWPISNAAKAQIAAELGGGSPNPTPTPSPAPDAGLSLTNLSGDRSSWDHYTVTVPANAQTLTVTINGGFGDADLYVRKGNRATLSEYDCRPWLNGNSENCTFNDPEAAVWHISVRGYRRYSGVSLNATIQTATSGNDNIDNEKVVSLKMSNRNRGLDFGSAPGANRQNVGVAPFNPASPGQQWIELDRGNGYFSYQARNTEFCLDGNNAPGNGKNAILWRCNQNNNNQLWEKVSLGGNIYRLEKRATPGFSLDGGGPGNNTHMWGSNNNNRNQQWQIQVN